MKNIKIKGKEDFIVWTNNEYVICTRYGKKSKIKWYVRDVKEFISNAVLSVIMGLPMILIGVIQILIFPIFIINLFMPRIYKVKE